MQIVYREPLASGALNVGVKTKLFEKPGPEYLEKCVVYKYVYLYIQKKAR